MKIKRLAVPLQVSGCTGMNHGLFISYPGPGPAQPILRTVGSGQVTELVQRTPTPLTLGSSLCTQVPTPLSYMLTKPSP